ncbi:MAG: hypothetical protein DRR19_05770 [Candidatus Parabeggiatoa sp. nov. 1]|nr:MAG: hypothetical protein DRR19_05770 [Gammaproteobacteria bacterium]
MIRFQEALENAIQLVKQHYTDLGGPPVLVRDLYGRIRIALPIQAPTDESTQYDDLAALFEQALGNFSYPSVFLYKDELFDSDALFNSPDKITVSGVQSINFRVFCRSRKGNPCGCPSIKIPDNLCFGA